MTAIMRNPVTCQSVLSITSLEVSLWYKNVGVPTLSHLMDTVKQPPREGLVYCHKLTPREKFRRAAKGIALFAKGTLRSDGLARMLVTSHWIEAIDPKHRYGSILKKYFKKWLEEDTDEDFFYWLDLGQGKKFSIDVPKGDRLITRSDLEASCVKYCNAQERRKYKTNVSGRHLVFAENGDIVHTSKGTWIFVMDNNGDLYVAPKERGCFHHSSFLAGGPTLAAGRLTVDYGMVTSLEAHSGHYRPERRHFEELLYRLTCSGLDLSRVEIDWSILEHNKRKAT